MKKSLLAVIAILSALPFISNAQNTFPTPNGNVGIGTTSPNAALVVTSGELTLGANGGLGQGGEVLRARTQANGNIVFANPSVSVSGGTALFSINDAANAIMPFHIRANPLIITDGNVGIGTTSAGDPLTVNGNISLVSSSVLYNGASNNSAGIGFAYGGVGSVVSLSGYNGILFNSSATGIGSQTERMRITNTGNVGIGTTTPSAKLDVQGGNATVYNNGSATSLIVGSGATGKTFLSMGTSADAGGYANLQAVAASGSTYGSLILNGTAGKVGIGTTIPDQLLTVKGTIHSQEVKVDLSVPGPDYVFHPTYKLPTLTEVKAFIDKNHHLSEIPSAAEMAKNGLDLGDMNVKLLKKVEELTLYLLEQQKQIEQLTQTVKALSEKIIQINNK